MAPKTRLGIKKQTYEEPKVQAWEDSNRQGSKPFIGHDLGPLFSVEKEIEDMVDHSGDELESPHINFDFEPTLLDYFLFRNKDRVLA